MSSETPERPGYPHFHQDRVNLAIHLVMVPLFVAGVVGAVWGAALGRWTWTAACAVLPVLSLAAQGIGHRREPNPPLPFEGAGNFVKRNFLEQFFRFPSFVLTRGCLEAWRAADGREA